MNEFIMERVNKQNENMDLELVAFVALHVVVDAFLGDLFVVLFHGGQVFSASPNSPSSMPSPTYQCTKARLAYMRSNLWSMRPITSAMAVVLLIMSTERCTLARSPPGTTVGGW